MRTRICFYGLFGQGNLGNEATLQAILHHTRRLFPHAELLCVCTDPRDASTRHDIAAVPISPRHLRKSGPAAASGSRGRLVRWLRRALIGVPREFSDWLLTFRRLIGKDVLVVPGTGFLTDASGSPFGWPYDIFKWSLVAKLCRCRLVYVGVGAGPVYRPLSRWFIRSALSLADFRSYRDSSTKEYLATIGFSRRADRICPDLAFSLPVAMLADTATESRQRPVVGIGLMNSPARLSAETPDPAVHRAYLATMAAFARWLLAHDYDVRLLIGDFAYDRDVLTEFAASLKREMPPDDRGRVLDTPALSVEELLSQIAATDLVVATRFHNVLLALLLKKPVASVSFHHKSVSLMRAMGLSEHSRDIGDLDLEWLIGQVDALQRNASALIDRMSERVEENRKILDEQYGLIFDGVGTHAERSELVRAGPPIA